MSTTPEHRAPAPPVLAVDIGGTKTTAAVVTETDGRPLPAVRLTVPTPAADGGAAVLAAALRLARLAAQEGAALGAAPVAVGFGTAGVVDAHGREIVAATSALPGWAGTELAAAAERELRLPATVLNDVQAFLAGECAAGAARHTEVAVGVMAGTGIGGAVAVGGRLLRGAHGAAGHLGHLPVPGAEGTTCPCGAAGHVEALAAGPAMAAEARHRLPHRHLPDLRAVAALAKAGDPVAQSVLHSGGYALGTALAGVVAGLDPDVIVLGGGATASGPWYETGLRAALAVHTLPLLAGVRVVRSALDADAVLIGAAAEARTLVGTAGIPRTRGPQAGDAAGAPGTRPPTAGTAGRGNPGAAEARAPRTADPGGPPAGTPAAEAGPPHAAVPTRGARGQRAAEPSESAGTP
ncbi:glucokinase [Kitasatospora sp. SolWspMP-SS2h]|uniref:ROK family protein n=1 Tax=Kitasatospora sp. SolWspMP-SS2h TaxID=1305729 RepID=UPI000DB9160A|nr:ROK family protein [Kitasatospora sp. SolWspMP-SS2h]RAJ36824.1 glucokinase [Kitasatospora sp. SolWspMP-SS2h]